MKRSFPTRSGPGPASTHTRSKSFSYFLSAFSACILAGSGCALSASAQAITIDTTGKATANPGQAGTVDRRYRQIEPTNITLPSTQLDPKTRVELLRFLQSDQGFAMRPFPRGHKGLTLVANGKLEPAGEAYLSLVTANGLSAKPGDRLVISDVKIDHTKIVFELNGGPDAKHRFLRHVQIGAGPDTSPIVQQGDEQEPVGSRLTLTFKNQIPELTGKQVEALLAPLISFEVKTPIQAFTDTLPPKLKEAILDHNVLVGMSTDMVLFAKGQPQNKIREMDGQMPFEEWIYGRSPSDIEFVRINGNRVIRVEVAKVGKTPVIFTKDEVEGMMRTDGTPLTPGDPSGTHTVQMGDVQRNPDTQAPASPPSLRKPGETVPADDGKDSRVNVMKPVQFPKQAPDDEPNARPNGPTDSTQPSAPAASQPAAPPANTQPPPAGTSQSTPDKPQPANGTPPPQ
ncbi:MAG TPA: hypothetical protein VMR02_00765 [Terracidiphilus sp.]|jgi:hypothetical protein|nr:hypothetical protein [Terracidiphilus sp.]